jgi:type I site-specific restriction endonuclease
LVRRILYPSDDDERPTPGLYDCMIVDEAHRGYVLDAELREDAYSDDVGRAFRLMSATCSDRSRPAVPIEVGRGGGAPAGRR